MPNSIPTDQNHERQLERLAAQRQLYSDAKRIQFWQTISSVPVVIGWSFVVFAVPELRVYAAFWSITVTFLDVLVLTPRQNRTKSMAAKIQETFDCDVLQISWQKLKIGRKPDAELVADAASRYRKNNSVMDALRNWYPIDIGI